jgi:eukaryotic-like serine/threonine-protein kinase
MMDGRGTAGKEEPEVSETQLATPAVPVEFIGPYRLVRKVGEGGMGEVWEARDTRLARNVAIKRLKVHSLRRFSREAQSIAALNHPNICHIYDVGSDYLVLEYIDGTPLLVAHPESSR